MADFAAFNTIYEQALAGAKPARSTVQVAALPRGAKVEIELIAEV
jgi:2-iminobutanoate/2-iminopropanoate deaminase